MAAVARSCPERAAAPGSGFKTNFSSKYRFPGLRAVHRGSRSTVGDFRGYLETCISNPKHVCNNGKGEKPKSQSGGGWINCDGALYCVFHKSASLFAPDDCNYKAELAVTPGGRTGAGHHLSMDFPCEHMKLVPRLAPVHRGGETGDLLLKKQVRRQRCRLVQEPRQAARFPHC